jgi:hypothetical protein
MATKRKTEDRQSRSLKTRHVPFTGLLAAVPATLLGWLLLHLAVREDMVKRVLWTLIVLVVGAGLAALAWGISSGRRTLIRAHVAASVGLAFTAGAVTVAIGWPAGWLLTYAVLGVFLAVSWMLYRLDALRSDKSDGEGDEDGLKAELGLKNVKFNEAEKHLDPKTGKLARVEISGKLTRGATVSQVQGALPSLESVANSIEKRGRVVGGERASEFSMTLIMEDLMKNMIPWPGPSAPGASITEPLVDGMYEDHEPLKLYIAGNHEDAANPAGRCIMGMTRNGKTMIALIDLMEMMTRRHVVVFWFDSIKGAQTVGPVRDALDIVVADDVESKDPKLFRAGMKALRRLIEWRATEMGRAGFREWTPEVAEKLGMPIVVAHFEEADILCEIAGDDMVFISSKGLSAGVIGSYSLQRADAVSMPTALRFNLGNRDCFGTGDEVSATFALDDQTIAAGARPDYWGQDKPGYLYRRGIGIPIQRRPVLAKGFFATFDQMAAHTAEWAHRMDSLDPGSVVVLGEWYQQMKQIMARPIGEAVPMPLSSPNGNGARSSTPRFVIEDEEAEEQREREEYREKTEEEIAEMEANGEFDDDYEDEDGKGVEMDVDPTQPIEPSPPGTPDVILHHAPEAPSKEAAELAFDRAAFELAADPTLWDPKTGEVVFTVGTFVDRYGFRSRPWFSARLTAVLEGKEQIRDPETRRPANATLSRGDKPGQYRMRLQRQLEAA